MRISGTRIRSLDRYLKGFKKGEMVVVGLHDLEGQAATLKKAGFSAELNLGESVLPAAVFGPISRFNVHGKYEVHKDQPMETAYRTIHWTWTEFRGRYDRVEKSDFRDLPYQRYPRTHTTGPALELQVASDGNGGKLVVAGPFDCAEQQEVLLHAVNLFLELFGECELINEALKKIARAKVVRLNWQLLPPGKHPWKTLQATLAPIIKANPKGNQAFVTNRLNQINAFEPEFIAFGRGGFYGYVVFGFPKRNLFVLESAFAGNATYVFEKNWKAISQLTKAEILDKGLHKERIVHLRQWFHSIRRLLAAK